MKNSYYLIMKFFIRKEKNDEIFRNGGVRCVLHKVNVCYIAGVFRGSPPEYLVKINGMRFNLR